ncbi:MAG TPA: hypothetical protein VE010_04060, partial [Thermoanaerobaculia bacterium]|nr:hypothetical protein [Thermoanaerobaculia bacterium]
EVPISDAFVDKLIESEVDTIIIHPDRMGGPSEPMREWLRRELERGRISFVRNFHTRLHGDWVFRIGGRGVRTPALEAFLRGEPPCGTATMGNLDLPAANERFRGRAIFTGWTMSPHGIAHVDVFIDIGGHRERARLFPDPRLDVRCPGWKTTRYMAAFHERPEGVRRHTDVWVEVTDTRGVKTAFDNRWITWE